MAGGRVWGGGGQDGCERRIKVFVKIKKKKLGGGGGWVGSGGRVGGRGQGRCERRNEFVFFFLGGGVRSGGVQGGSQGGCEQRIEVFVKIQKNIYFFLFFFGGGGRGESG